MNNDFYDDGDLLDNNTNNNNNNVRMDDSHAPNNNPQNLQFHDFQEENDFYNNNNTQPNNNYNPPNNNYTPPNNEPSFSHDEKIFMEEDKPQEQNPTTPSNASFYEAEYYQPYFNVDSKEVLTRVLYSIWPFTSKFFQHIKDNPDLWGTFWISTSLIFLMTVSSNLENYFTALIQNNADNWAPDLQKLPWATIAVYVYVGVLPVVFWVVFRCKKIPISLAQFYCTYGYSLFIYLPISVIVLVAVGKLSWLSWILIMFACAISTTFLVVNFIFIIKPHSNALLTLIIPMALCSVGLALAFKLYLFKFPAATPTSAPTTLAPTSAPSTAPSLSPF